MKSVLSRFTHFDVETNLAKTCACWTNYKYQVCTHPHACTATGLEQIDQHDNKDVRAPDSGDLTQPNFVIFFPGLWKAVHSKIDELSKKLFSSKQGISKRVEGKIQISDEISTKAVRVIYPNWFHIFELFPISIRSVFLGCVVSEPSPLPHNYIVG